MIKKYTTVCPRIFPGKGDVAPSEIDRVQSLEPSTDLNREEKKEVGSTHSGYLKKRPTTNLPIRQLEYGNFEVWRKVTNVADSVDKITLDDFASAYFDYTQAITDVDGVFTSTVWLPELRTSGFSIGIGDPEADIERNFTFIAEYASEFQGDNKYFIYVRHEAGSGNDDEIDLSANTPAVLPDEDVSGYADEKKYILKVLRVRGAVTTKLTVTTDYTYDNATEKLTLITINTGDVIKVYHTSATAPAVIFTPNTTDVMGLSADCCTIELVVGGVVREIQSITMDAALTREDFGGIGFKEVQHRGVSENKVSFSLGSLLSDLTLEEAFRGVADGYGQINFEKFSDDIGILIKIYSDNTKTTFKYGFKSANLSPVSINPASVGVDEHAKTDHGLEGKELIISANILDIA